jgi:hypothetical protein
MEITSPVEAGSVAHRTMAEIEAGLAEVERSPQSVGTLELVVRRPAVDAREVLDKAQLDLALGLVGDTWNERPSTRTGDRTPHPDMQLNVINARFIELISGPDRRVWALAGDQLYVDLDLSPASLPAGTQIALGDQAVIEVTDQPHTGCAKFAARFGRDAHTVVWSDQGRRLRLRGLNAKVVVPGTIHSGDVVRVLPAG